MILIIIILYLKLIFSLNVFLRLFNHVKHLHMKINIVNEHSIPNDTHKHLKSPIYIIETNELFLNLPSNI